MPLKVYNGCFARRRLSFSLLIYISANYDPVGEKRLTSTYAHDRRARIPPSVFGAEFEHEWTNNDLKKDKAIEQQIYSYDSI